MVMSCRCISYLLCNHAPPQQLPEERARKAHRDRHKTKPTKHTKRKKETQKLYSYAY